MFQIKTNNKIKRIQVHTKGPLGSKSRWTLKFFAGFTGKKNAFK